MFLSTYVLQIAASTRVSASLLHSCFLFFFFHCVCVVRSGAFFPSVLGVASSVFIPNPRRHTSDSSTHPLFSPAYLTLLANSHLYPYHPEFTPSITPFSLSPNQFSDTIPVISSYHPLSLP